MVVFEGMKLSELDARKRDKLIKQLGSYIYPLYITTNVTGFEYHFIGTSFLMEKDGRKFFIFTRHQALQIGEGVLCIGIEEGGEGHHLRIDREYIREFPSSDLAIFELDHKDRRDVPALDSSLIRPPNSNHGSEIMVLGFPRALSAVDHEKKIINPKKIAIISEDIELNDGFDSIDLRLSSYQLSAEKHHLEALDSFENITQGLSGSPMFTFDIQKVDNHKGHVDINMIGVTTNVAETTYILNATRTHELIACLQIGFSVYPEIKS
jgi:hypothetical protein